MIEVELKEWGNSIGVILPSDILRELGVNKGDKIAINVIAKRKIDGFGMCKGAKPFKEEKEEHREF